MARKFTPWHKIILATDLNISTWLVLGACGQSLIFTLLPRTLSLILPVFVLLCFYINTYFIASGRLPNDLAQGVNYGRISAQYPDDDGSPSSKPSKDSIVVLVLGTTFSHPQGRLAPHVARTGNYMSKMWKEAAAMRDTYGYLGNTPAMSVMPDNGLNFYGPREGDDKGTTMVWLSYWKTLDGLHAFAHGPTHMQGWRWFEKGMKTDYKHIGLMHELYEVPAGSWENIYYNFRPFGLCKFRPDNHKEKADVFS
jgi:hypothetical protein